jgi:hypothetical protein
MPLKYQPTDAHRAAYRAGARKTQALMAARRAAAKAAGALLPIAARASATGASNLHAMLDAHGLGVGTLLRKHVLAIRAASAMPDSPAALGILRDLIALGYRLHGLLDNSNQRASGGVAVQVNLLSAGAAPASPASAGSPGSAGSSAASAVEAGSAGSAQAAQAAQAAESAASESSAAEAGQPQAQAQASPSPSVPSEAEA